MVQSIVDCFTAHYTCIALNNNDESTNGDSILFDICCILNTKAWPSLTEVCSLYISYKDIFIIRLQYCNLFSISICNPICIGKNSLFIYFTLFYFCQKTKLNNFLMTLIILRRIFFLLLLLPASSSSSNIFRKE